MAATATKRQVLDRLREERAYWEALLSEMPEERMDEPGAMGEWTMKDTIAHLTNWSRFHVARVASARRHERPVEHPPQRQVPIVNEWVTAMNRDRPLADVLRDARDVWDDMEEQLRGLPDDEALTGGHAQGADEGGVGADVVEWFVKHLHEEHEPEIRGWLGQGRQSAAA